MKLRIEKSLKNVILIAFFLASLGLFTKIVHADEIHYIGNVSMPGEEMYPNTVETYQKFPTEQGNQPSSDFTFRSEGNVPFYHHAFNRSDIRVFRNSGPGDPDNKITQGKFINNVSNSVEWHNAVLSRENGRFYLSPRVSIAYSENLDLFSDNSLFACMAYVIYLDDIPMEGNSGLIDRDGYQFLLYGYTEETENGLIKISPSEELYLNCFYNSDVNSVVCELVDTGSMNISDNIEDYTSVSEEIAEIENTSDETS